MNHYRNGYNVCVAEPTCGDNEYNNNHICSCITNHYRNGLNACVAEPTCGVNE